MLILDPHPLVRRGLRALLETESDMTVCGDADPASFAFSRLSRLRPDVVLVAASARDRSTIATIRTLRHTCRSVSIVALSLYDDPDRVQPVLAAGASEVVVKMAERVLAAIRRARPGAGGATAKPGRAGRTGAAAAVRADEVALDAAELELVTMIGGGLPLATIAVRVREPVTTIESRVAALRVKLGLATPVQLVEFCVARNRRLQDARK